MKLLIDVQALQSPNTRNRGIDRYTRSLTTALAKTRSDWHIELVQNKNLPAIDCAGLTGLPMTAFEPPFGSESEDAGANELFYGDWLAAPAPDAVLLGSCFDEHVLMPRFVNRRPRLFAILYDLIPLLFHEQLLNQPGSITNFGERFRRILTVDGVLAISQASADDLRMLADGRCPPVSVIGGAADDRFAPTPEVELDRWRDHFRRRFGLERDFILYVGGFDFRKNLRGAIGAFAALPEPHRRRLDLVIACHLVPAHRRQVEEWGREFGIADSLKLPGYVSDEELRALYCTCRVFFFPSLYEGLGLPVLEALRCGAPVAASNRSSIPEVAGSVSWSADPESPAGMTAALVAALNEPRNARTAERVAHANRFTWETTAELAAHAIAEGCNAQHVPSSIRVEKRRRRIAWVSPLPPTVSGIADYSAELLGPLAEHFDIELVVSPSEPYVVPEITKDFLVVGAHELPARHDAHPFDQFIYHVGNSHHHVYMLDLLRRYRGLVVLHDFFLGGLVLPATLAGAWPVSLADELEAEGEKTLADQLRRATIGAHDVIGEAPLNRRILSQAGGVIVHSGWSWGRVRKLTSAPVTRIPHFAEPPVLPSREAERRRLGLPADPFVIATLGFVGPPKRIPSLFRAVAALPEEVRKRTLVLIVGYAPPSEEKTLHALAEETGLSSQVQFVGRVKLADFAAYARAADVCVQLRYPTRGETSGALLRELAAGAACIVSDHGSIAELPDDVAVKVRTPEHEVSDLSAALRRLYQDPDERARLGAAAVRHVKERHSLGHVIQQYAAMIELTAAKREADEALWSEFACDALAACTDPMTAQRGLHQWLDLRRDSQSVRRDAAEQPSSEVSPRGSGATARC